VCKSGKGDPKMEYEQHPKYWDINHDELRESYQKITDQLAREKARDFKWSVYLISFCISILISIAVVVLQVPSSKDKVDREMLETSKK
jgi:hypothetical protein